MKEGAQEYWMDERVQDRWVGAGRGASYGLVGKTFGWSSTDRLNMKITSGDNRGLSQERWHPVMLSFEWLGYILISNRAPKSTPEVLFRIWSDQYEEPHLGVKKSEWEVWKKRDTHLDSGWIPPLWISSPKSEKKFLPTSKAPHRGVGGNCLLREVELVEDKGLKSALKVKHSVLRLGVFSEGKNYNFYIFPCEGFKTICEVASEWLEPPRRPEPWEGPPGRTVFTELH